MTSIRLGLARRLDFVRARRDRMKGMIHPQTRALHRYYDDLRAGRLVPRRAEVDPRDMPCRASHLFILEDRGGGALHFRLGGSALQQALGAEMRGLSVRDLMQGRGGESLVALIDETLAEPGIGYARLERTDRPDEIWEALFLPMRSDGGRIDRVLGSLLPLEGAGAPARGRPGLGFSILEMTIRPIREAGPVRGAGLPARTPEGGVPPAPGFAEGQAGFDGPGQGEGVAARPGAALRGPFIAIEGGRAETTPPAGDRPRPPHLRIVKGD